MANQTFDLIVIGAGPGGYVAAVHAAKAGLKVACIEKEPIHGGTCLRVGCIPSKAMLESSEHFARARDELASHGVKLDGVALDLPAMMARKDQIVTTLGRGIAGLFKKHGVTPIAGHARLVAPGAVSVGEVKYEAKWILIATGSRVATLPGVELGARVGTSTEALVYPEVPRELIVIGAGAIGLELGSVWGRLGAKVTVLEYLDRILPGTDSELAGEMRKVLEKQGLAFQLGVRVTGATEDAKTARVSIEGAPPLTADRVLVAVGRRPNTEGLGLEDLGIATDKGGRIPVDAHYQTSVPGVFAIGDVIAGPMLAHKAEAEGVACVERLVTGYGHVDYDTIPSIVYTHPELASVGKTEDELRGGGVKYRKGSYPFLANGRARTLGDTAGRVKVLADDATDRILGVHILGPRAGDLIAEAVAAMAYGATAEDVALTCHAHPTLSETLKEAAAAAAASDVTRR
jgi:dihydrolipoamide dehydrogenase